MTPKQEQALRDYLQEAIVPLIEQVLVKKLGQAMTFAAQEVVSPKRTWVGLTEKEILECRSVNHLYFYKAIEDKLKEKNT
jgi:hypothetical protein